MSNPSANSGSAALIELLHGLGPYELKQGAPGWWVDGSCGYLVAGYYSTKKEAVRVACDRIVDAKRNGNNPSWLFNY